MLTFTLWVFFVHKTITDNIAPFKNKEKLNLEIVFVYIFYIWTVNFQVPGYGAAEPVYMYSYHGSFKPVVHQL